MSAEYNDHNEKPYEEPCEKPSEKPSLYDRMWPDEEQETPIAKRNPFWRELPLSHRLWPDMGPPQYIAGLTSERAIRCEWDHWLANLYKKDKDYWD